MEYNNKVILISGASSGIGRALAIELAGFNNKIIITARREELLKSTAVEIEKRGSSCLYIAGDATVTSHGAEAVSAAIREFGRIDIALLNVGIGPPSNSLTASPETILKCMRTNFDTFINFYCPVMAQMKKQGDPCFIAHVNSQASYFGIPMQGDYTASKGAVRLFMETARMELKHFGINHITLQTIHPGFVDTDAVRDDGIPAPNEISEDESVRHILKGIRKEMRENLFPGGTALALRLGQFLPHRILTKILLASTPEEY